MAKTFWIKQKTTGRIVGPFTDRNFGENYIKRKGGTILETKDEKAAPKEIPTIEAKPDDVFAETQTHAPEPQKKSAELVEESKAEVPKAESETTTTTKEVVKRKRSPNKQKTK